MIHRTMGGGDCENDLCSIIFQHPNDAISYRGRATFQEIYVNMVLVEAPALSSARLEIDHILASSMRANSNYLYHLDVKQGYRKSKYEFTDTFYNNLPMMTSGHRNALRITILCGNPPVTSGFPSQRANNVELWCFRVCTNNAELWCFLWCYRDKSCRRNSRVAGDPRRHDAHVASL